MKCFFYMIDVSYVLSSEPVSYVKFACLQAFKSSQTLFGRVWQACFIVNTALEQTNRQINAELS